MSFQRCILIIFLLISSFSAFTGNHVIADALIVPSLKQQRIRCHDHEKAALLQFKQSFLIDCEVSTPPFAYPKTKSWQQHAFMANGSKFADDCCTWEGVECDKDTNFVRSLDLSSSCLSGLSGELPYSIGNLGRLKQLTISICSFSGRIPASLGNLTKLNTLDLGVNDFSGTMPSSLTNLTNLRELSLMGLDVRPKILNSWLLKLNKLFQLRLIDMNMGNKIPSNLANLTSLTELYLERNYLSGAVPQWFANLTQLTDLELYGNKLQGPVQPWLSMLVNLQILGLSDIKFNGIFEQFLELPNIKVLLLSNLNLTFVPNVITNDSSLAKLIELDLSYCNLTEFPQSLRHQNELLGLHLHGNHIGGHIPQWFMEINKESLLYLDLSSNSLVGFERPFVFLPWTNLQALYLGGNKLRGTLPIPSYTMQDYEISNNNLSGTIPKTICLARSLAILDLSNNSMSGLIPHCIGHQLGNSLQVLNLRGNSFHGAIPQRFTKSCTLKMINLSENQLEDQLPRSLANCTMLEVLDLGKNRVNDTFPSWQGTLPTLQVLVLRHNRFHGNIIDDNNKSSHVFEQLRIIDISYNFHGGTLPLSYLQSRRGMKVTMEDQSSSSNSFIMIFLRQGSSFNLVLQTYNYVITITNKGSETLYPRILSVFRVVDLSSNNFIGKIPSLLGDLKGLQVLNLSNNNLEGIIPSSLSMINDLESLDLSQNKLSGVIPEELSKLTFLEIFNVSHNHLVGSIPQGPQFNNFDNSSYDGNLGLCGGPLSKKCGIVPPSQQGSDDGDSEDDSDMIGSIVRALGCASGFVVGYVIGKLYITDKYHVWFIRTFARKRKSKSRRRNASNQRRNR